MKLSFDIIDIIALIIILNYIFSPTLLLYKSATFNDLKELSAEIEEIIIDESANNVYFYTNSTSYITKISSRSDFESLLFKNNIDTSFKYRISSSIFTSNFVILIASIILVVKMINIFQREVIIGDNFYSINNNTNTKFTDVIGQNEAKFDLKTCIDYFKKREQLIKYGYKIPKGFIFSGPPGTGKTMLAKALAHEAGVTFISTAGSNFMELYVGTGQKRVKELFNIARKRSPAIIFIDEIDAIGAKREGQNQMHSEYTNTLNALLYQLDGFDNNDNIIVIGSTNRYDSLDSALVRSGRFDKEIIFDRPNINERKELFKLYLKNRKTSEEFNNNLNHYIDILSKKTAGLTGADINNICNQSLANLFYRSGYFPGMETDYGVKYDDICKAIDIVLIGMEKKERLMTDEEKKRVSYHEAGHALLAYCLEDSEPPIKISIIPRGKTALGFTQHEPNDRKILRENYIYAQIIVLFGGRAAEQFTYGDFSTGASDDIEKATKLIYDMVTKYGMGNHIPINSSIHNNNISKYISQKKLDDINDFCENKVKDLYEYSLKMIKIYQDKLKIISDYLYENEEINKEKLEELLGSDIRNVLNVP